MCVVCAWCVCVHGVCVCMARARVCGMPVWCGVCGVYIRACMACACVHVRVCVCVACALRPHGPSDIGHTNTLIAGHNSKSRSKISHTAEVIHSADRSHTRQNSVTEIQLIAFLFTTAPTSRSISVIVNLITKMFLFTTNVFFAGHNERSAAACSGGCGAASLDAGRTALKQEQSNCFFFVAGIGNDNSPS